MFSVRLTLVVPYSCTCIYMYVHVHAFMLHVFYMYRYFSGGAVRRSSSELQVHVYGYSATSTYNLKHVLFVGVQYGPVQYGLVTMNSPGLTYRQACTYYPVTCDVGRVVQWLNEMRFALCEWGLRTGTCGG